MSDADSPKTPPVPAPRARRRWLLAAVALVALLGLVIGAAWLQTWRVRRNLTAAEPLAIAARATDRAAVKAVEARLRAQVEQGAEVRISGEEMTVLVQEALRDRSLLGTLRAERRRAVAGLARLPDPLGLWRDLRLEELDLRRVAAEVDFADGVARLRLTVPYRDAAQHLNVEARVTGHWRRGDVAFDVESLRLGDLDVVGLLGFGPVVEEVIEGAVLQRASRLSMAGLREARIDGDRVVFGLAVRPD